MYQQKSQHFFQQQVSFFGFIHSCRCIPTSDVICWIWWWWYTTTTHTNNIQFTNQGIIMFSSNNQSTHHKLIGVSNSIAWRFIISNRLRGVKWAILFIVDLTLSQTCQREWTRWRNVRSKSLCSMCLQFALFIAASCVLHRSTSRVIHR